jgi:hypothetical protein
MSAVLQADNTVVAIRRKVRRLTASASQSALSDDNIDRAINTFYNSDFPYAIKIDQMRSVYTFFTEPYRDRYPLDVNFAQGVRSPFYVEGIQGNFMKDRQQFYNVWPRFPTLLNPISGDGITTAFSFSAPGPFLSREVVLGGVDITGAAISVNDDGNGNLQLQIPNPVISIPPQYRTPNNPLPPVPGMKNINTGNPGLNYVDTTTKDLSNVNFPAGIGTVNYVTGAFEINFPVAPAAGTQITLWISQYQTGRPYSLLFWNNEFTIRPVPKLVHKCEVEVFLTPVQFMLTTDVPILNQWWQYIAYGASMEILRDRQDTDGVENLREGFMRQESLVLERQSIEEIFQPNIQLFNQTTQVYGGVGGIGYY